MISDGGRQEKEYEMILRRTLQSICFLTVYPNTTTSIIVQGDWCVARNGTMCLSTMTRQRWKVLQLDYGVLLLS
ncbi:hypothetical protein KSP40_PGU009235 [Platanthera guangdongensis]|uniref:Uncharacterized protein n=1 Tax=Platanthera guangdongensis TaxID=2320717 RepID=A0ABR2MSZ8_9ASPA